MPFNQVIQRIAFATILVMAMGLAGCGGSGNPALGVAATVSGTAVTGTTTGTQVTFTATVSGTTPISYAWDFGGGAVPGVSTAASPTVVLGAAGTYNCTVTVDNIFGLPATRSFTITVTAGGGGGGGTWPTDVLQLAWLMNRYIPLPNLASPNRVYQDAAHAAAADQAVALMNVERGNAGSGALSSEPHLEALAQAHSWHMAVDGFFAHDTPQGLGVSDRLAAIDPPVSPNNVGENIGAGYPDATAVVTAWMGSAGHRANILDTSYTHVGIGAYYHSGDNTTYWTAVFVPISGDPATHTWIEPGDSQP